MVEAGVDAAVRFAIEAAGMIVAAMIVYARGVASVAAVVLKFAPAMAEVALTMMNILVSTMVVVTAMTIVSATVAVMANLMAAMMTAMMTIFLLAMMAVLNSCAAVVASDVMSAAFTGFGDCAHRR